MKVICFTYLYIYIYTSYITENTIDVNYKDQPNNVVKEYKVLVRYRFSAGGTYSYHRALNGQYICRLLVGD
jgi:hypothetical protein